MFFDKQAETRPLDEQYAMDKASYEQQVAYLFENSGFYQDKLRAADRAIVQTYLKHLNLRWGLLVNFGKKEFEARYVWLT